MEKSSRSESKVRFGVRPCETLLAFKVTHMNWDYDGIVLKGVLDTGRDTKGRIWIEKMV